jgi:hypothetical protein
LTYLTALTYLTHLTHLTKRLFNYEPLRTTGK